jgi:hypothetical protein
MPAHVYAYSVEISAVPVQAVIVHDWSEIWFAHCITGVRVEEQVQLQPPSKEIAGLFIGANLRQAREALCRTKVVNEDARSIFDCQLLHLHT